MKLADSKLKRLRLCESDCCQVMDDQGFTPAMLLDSCAPSVPPGFASTDSAWAQVPTGCKLSQIARVKARVKAFLLHRVALCFQSTWP